MLPCCIDGANPSPPEDVGGPDAYRKFCRANARKAGWMQQQAFDPSHF
jgi:hypothetical protein